MKPPISGKAPAPTMAKVVAAKPKKAKMMPMAKRGTAATMAANYSAGY